MSLESAFSASLMQDEPTSPMELLPKVIKARVEFLSRDSSIEDAPTGPMSLSDRSIDLSVVLTFRDLPNEDVSRVYIRLHADSMVVRVVDRGERGMVCQNFSDRRYSLPTYLIIS